jgi:hypothetical protein
MDAIPNSMFRANGETTIDNDLRRRSTDVHKKAPNAQILLSYLLFKRKEATIVKEGEVLNKAHHKFGARYGRRQPPI